MPLMPVVLDAGSLSQPEFERRFELPSQPCLLRGLVAEWPAARVAWSVARLCERFPTHEWDMGLETGVATTLPAFLREHRAAAAASAPRSANANALEPARYIFDDVFGEALPELLRDFDIPPMFPAYSNDPLSYLSTLPALRPRYRWLLIGAPGSGFTIHQDPYATSAWNTLLEGGRKRWVLLPPTTPIGLVLPSLGGERGGVAATPAPDVAAAPPGAPLPAAISVNPNQPQQPPPYWIAPDSEDGSSDAGAELPECEASAAAWFTHVLPGLRARALTEFGLPDEAALGLLEVEQLPGDTLFIPAGWWHVAVTMPPLSESDAGGGERDEGFTVAVTYNYLPVSGFRDALARLAAQPDGARAAFRWCRRAADAGLPEAARCLVDLPALVAAASSEASLAESRQ